MRTLILLLLILPVTLNAQTFHEDIAKFRQHYKEEFITEKNSPLKAADTGYLRFYAPNEKYKVVADVVLTKDAQPFKIPTRNKKEKEYKEYAVLQFRIKGKRHKLHVYQMVKWADVPEYKDLLFVPFTDLTNYEETYGGGRYIDLDIKDIKNGKIEVDFNKCYNPYCAFAEGYSCPIPPKENALNIAIKAGEKKYGKKGLE